MSQKHRLGPFDPLYFLPSDRDWETKLLHQALKNISLDNNLGEIRSAYNEVKDEE